MRRRVRCFYEDFNKTGPYTVMDAGIRVIELKRKDRESVVEGVRVINACGYYDLQIDV